MKVKQNAFWSPAMKMHNKKKSIDKSNHKVLNLDLLWGQFYTSKCGNTIDYNASLCEYEDVGFIYNSNLKELLNLLQDRSNLWLMYYKFLSRHASQGGP